MGALQKGRGNRLPPGWGRGRGPTCKQAVTQEGPAKAGRQWVSRRLLRPSLPPATDQTHPGLLQDGLGLAFLGCHHRALATAAASQAELEEGRKDTLGIAFLSRSALSCFPMGDWGWGVRNWHPSQHWPTHSKFFLAPCHPRNISSRPPPPPPEAERYPKSCSRAAPAAAVYLPSATRLAGNSASLSRMFLPLWKDWGGGRQVCLQGGPATVLPLAQNPQGTHPAFLSPA